MQVIPLEGDEHMTGFERRGCEFQMDSRTVSEAVKNFAYSCKVCCNKGVRISCDRCAIAVTHENVVAAIRDAEEEYRKREVESVKAQKRMALTVPTTI